MVALLAFEAIILPHPPNLALSAHYHSLQITFVIVLYLIIKMKLKYTLKHSNTLAALFESKTFPDKNCRQFFAENLIFVRKSNG